MPRSANPRITALPHMMVSTKWRLREGSAGSPIVADSGRVGRSGGASREGRSNWGLTAPESASRVCAGNNLSTSPRGW
jgi:hypothetical protein